MKDQIEYLKKQVSILVNLYNTGRHEEVVQKGKVLIKKFPDQEIFINATALALSSLNKNDDAMKILKIGIQNSPNNIFILNNLGLISTRLNKNKIAREYFEKALSINKDYIDALVNLANLDLTDMNMDDAKSNYERALELSKSKQSDEIIYTALGHYHQQVGNFELALKNLYKVNEINPQNTTVDKSISLITKYKDKNHDHLKSMENKLNLNLSKDQKQSLYFSLGKAYEDIKSYKESFEFLSLGNKIANDKYKYNFNDDERLFQQLHELFKSNRGQLKTDIKTKIIFIVGMPRSGTTLVEQILSSHNNVYGAGELSFLSDAIYQYVINDKKFINNKIENIPEGKLKLIQSDYLENLENFNFKEDYLVDKAPLNFRWIGFIKILFPNSKIIHCTRDPMDTCFSNYKNSFSGPSLSFGYNLRNLGNFFNLYKKLMEYWNKKFDKDIYNLSYERLVGDQEKETKQLLEFCNLDWDKNCLKPHKNRSKVATASLAQVRTPVYKSSIKKWENYSGYLTELKKIIE